MDGLELDTRCRKDTDLVFMFGSWSVAGILSECVVSKEGKRQNQRAEEAHR